MIAEMLDAADSLAELMEEESAELTRRGRHRDHGEIAVAKTRLVGQLEAGIASMARTSPDWMERLDEEDRSVLRETMGRLCDAAKVNATVLDRQLSLSGEMMAAVAAEAKRLAGSRSSSYLPSGGLVESDGSRPISVNTRL